MCKQPAAAVVLLQEEVLLEVLGLANQYGFVELQSAMSEYLKAVLHIRNVCLIFDIASMYGLRSLCETCCQFMDHNAAEILQSEGFLTLSLVCLQSCSFKFVLAGASSLCLFHCVSGACVILFVFGCQYQCNQLPGKTFYKMNSSVGRKFLLNSTHLTHLQCLFFLLL